MANKKLLCKSQVVVTCKDESLKRSWLDLVQGDVDKSSGPVKVESERNKKRAKKQLCVEENALIGSNNDHVKVKKCLQQQSGGTLNIGHTKAKRFSSMRGFLNGSKPPSKKNHRLAYHQEEKEDKQPLTTVVEKNLKIDGNNNRRDHFRPLHHGKGGYHQQQEPIASAQKTLVEDITEALSPLQKSFALRLRGSYFRHLNEELYTQSGEESFKKFQEQPWLFSLYHHGYREQVSKWPEDPLLKIISCLNKFPNNCVIADFGCGEARLAQNLPTKKVHSFDLVAFNSYITACNISKVPLEDDIVDVGVFCLSLMGENITEYLVEAHRVLKIGALLKIVEVRSRFDGLESFKKSLQQLGWKITKVLCDNKMFITFDCIKKHQPSSSIHPSIILKPCIYKRR